MSSGPERTFRAGTHVGGYTLLSRLGMGGMAEVFLGRADGMAGFTRYVAIKRMRPELTTNPEFVNLFLEEARTASLLTHPNICQIHELTSVDGQYFMVMEFLEGVPLSTIMIQLFKEPGPFPIPFITGIIIQACEGMHYAHELCDADGQPYNIIHRDVSPPNLFVTTAGIAKLLDFGIAKSRNSLVRTMTGQIRGKFSYMSPEQLRGEKLDRRSDVFSLGIVLFEMLAGRRLFRRRSRLNIFHAIVRDPLPSVREFRSDIGDDLTAVVDRALSRDRDQRYPSARALGDDLVRVAHNYGGPMSTRGISDIVMHHFGHEISSKRSDVAQGSDSDARKMHEHRAGQVGGGSDAPTPQPLHATLPPDAATLITEAPQLTDAERDAAAPPEWVDTNATTEVLTAADVTAVDLSPAPEHEDDEP